MKSKSIALELFLIFKLLFLLIFASCNERTRENDTSFNTINRSNGNASNGSTLYFSNCQTCHGTSGGGSIGPDIRSSSDQQIYEATVNGKGSMPSFPNLTDQEIEDIASYIETFN